MNNLESISSSTRQHCNYYRYRIAEHTPPQNAHDERMINLYRRLLIRDSSLLHNLELLEISEAMHLAPPCNPSNDQLYSSEPSSLLNLDELRNLLDDNT
jgi:hypothetical protein